MFLRVTGTSTVAEGKVDPVHQFTIEPLFGTDHWAIAGHNIAFTNSALWMVITTLVLMVFVGGGAKRAQVPGRWQMAVEGLTGFGIAHQIGLGPLVDGYAACRTKFLPFCF